MITAIGIGVLIVGGGLLVAAICIAVLLLVIKAVL